MKLNLEEWRELARPYYEVIPRAAPDKAGVFIQAAPVDNLLTTRLEAPEQLLVHDPAGSKDTCHEYLLFERFYRGVGKGEVGDSIFDVDPQTLHLIDMSQRFVTSKKRSSSRGVLIPHSAIGYTPGQDPAYASIRLHSPSGQVLAAAHEALISVKGNGGAAEASAMAGAFLDLVSRLMFRRDECRSERLGLAPSDDFVIREFINRHLGHPDMDVSLLTSKFRISRATLYRQFDDVGGVAQYIRDRRLDRCFFELAGTRPERGRIKDVAKSWQFRDPSHFNRLFRRRFGMSPSDCLATHASDGARAPVALAQLSETWLSQLAGSQ